MWFSPLALLVALWLLDRELARSRRRWRKAYRCAAALLSGLLLVLTLWVCFGLDYGTTRRVYFSVAMLHVLAEVPFLLRIV